MPLADRIVVKTVDRDHVTAKEKPEEGKVIAVGSGRLTDAGRRVPVAVVNEP